MYRASRLVSHLCSDSVSSLHIRQVVLLAADLETATSNLCAVLGTSCASYRDPEIKSLGLKNIVMPVGQGMFLEVISPLDLKADNTANRQLVRRKGDGGYMIMLQTNNLAYERARLERLGFKVVMESDSPEMKEIHLHPKDTGRVIVSVSEPCLPQSWCWGGPDWQKVVEPSHIIDGVRKVVIQADDVQSTILQFEKLLGCEYSGAFCLQNGQKIEIVKALDGRGGGLAGISFGARSSGAFISKAVQGVQVVVS